MKMLFFKNFKGGYFCKDVKPQQRTITLQGDLLTKGHKMCFFSILTREVVLEPDQGHKLPVYEGSESLSHLKITVQRKCYVKGYYNLMSSLWLSLES